MPEDFWKLLALDDYDSIQDMVGDGDITDLF